MRISDWSSDVCSSDLRRQRLPGKHLPHQDAPEGLRPGPLPVRGKGAQPVVQGADEDRGAAQARDRGVVPRPQPGGVGAPVTSGSGGAGQAGHREQGGKTRLRGSSEEHTSELQSLMRISYAVFCLEKQITKDTQIIHITN